MELVNTFYGIKDNLKPEDPITSSVIRFTLETILLLLSPMVPHLAEELWQAIGHEESIITATWPSYSKEALEEEQILIVVQVNGKVRSRFQITADATDEEIKNRALADERIVARIAGRPIKKVIVVKKKLVNIVV